MTEQSAPALKEIFNHARLRDIAAQTAAVHPGFDAARFLAATAEGLDDLSLMARLRRVSVCLHDGLPADYAQALEILRRLAPRLDNRFVTLVLPEYVAMYGLDDYDRSMAALRFFTAFGSSEFAVRPFLRRDLARGLALMERWSRDDNEHVRRLASEGSRPRLPWSFRLEALLGDPSPVKPILDNLRADPSLYVRKSVANHLNDITKDHPDWVMDLLEGWPLQQPPTAWIARHALRTLIKQGDRRALGLVGAGEAALVSVGKLRIAPAEILLGDALRLAFRLSSTSPLPQRLVIDYAIHYVKKSGGTSVKVFKLKTLTLAPLATVEITRSQTIRNFTTRMHYAGKHAVEVFINGECLARGAFIIR
ncbi:DNA alkylation repair protein [Acerihabitans arboris]|uniref:DNA alkylation repair protein n=1 Tax=Acerihabitans arboris TaxID=2691583 RepID=A0A845SJN9_9GAMM|nr:DNA alkylation repair protein [Acerihabitans arboris]NDL61545.1 DNA alkylation repair protein [Acerihabitans arboris]